MRIKIVGVLDLYFFEVQHILCTHTHDDLRAQKQVARVAK